MKAPRKVADKHEVVVDATSLNKGTLALRGQGVHEKGAKRNARTLVIIFAKA